MRVIRIRGPAEPAAIGSESVRPPFDGSRAGQPAESWQSSATPVDRMSRERGRTHGGGNAKLGRIEAQAGAAPAVSSVAESSPVSRALARSGPLSG